MYNRCQATSYTFQFKVLFQVARHLTLTLVRGTKGRMPFVCSNNSPSSSLLRRDDSTNQQMFNHELMGSFASRKKNSKEKLKDLTKAISCIPTIRKNSCISVKSDQYKRKIL
jgi:hypothetical protein